MNTCRKIERTLYFCPETEPEQYGMIPKDILKSLLLMGTEYDRPVMYGFVRTNSLEEQYFDIYVIDSNRPNGYVRFIIQEGKRMDSQTEDLLNHYCTDEGTLVDNSLETLLRAASNKYYKGIHMKAYKEDKKLMLSHLYYSFQQGPRELLFKSGLGYLGANLECFDELDFEGSTPSQILYNLPIKFLRATDTPEGVNFLKQIDNYSELERIARELCSNVQYLAPLNEFQTRYIFECVENGREFSKDIFYYLYHFKNKTQVDNYYSYLKRRIQIRKYKQFPLTPAIEHLSSCEAEAERIWKVAVDEREEYEDAFIINKRFLDRKYGYRDREIWVMAPTLDDFIREAISQNNCLLSNYIEAHASGRCAIMLVRSATNPDKSYITMEIRDETIVTALKKNNKDLDSYAMGLVNDYAKLKKLDVRYDYPFVYDEDWDDMLVDEEEV